MEGLVAHLDPWTTEAPSYSSETQSMLRPLSPRKAPGRRWTRRNRTWFQLQSGRDSRHRNNHDTVGHVIWGPLAGGRWGRREHPQLPRV